jgi:hypothetical protein
MRCKRQLRPLKWKGMARYFQKLSHFKRRDMMISHEQSQIMKAAAKKFKLALDRVRPGEKIIYHTGSLAYDRQVAFGEHSQRIDGDADAAMASYRAGKVSLLQKRTGRVITETEFGKVYEFQYIAVKQ